MTHSRAEREGGKEKGKEANSPTREAGFGQHMGAVPPVAGARVGGGCHPHVGAGRGYLVNKPSWLFCLSTLSVLTCAVPNLRVLLFNK